MLKLCCSLLRLMMQFGEIGVQFVEIDFFAETEMQFAATDNAVC